MKLTNRILILAALATVAMCSVAGAAQRLVLWEHFTNWSCGPCAAWNPTVRSALDAMGPDTVVSIKYHVNWPGANDGFYLQNTAEQQQRWGFYNVTGVPDAFVDGTQNVQSGTSAATIKSVVRTHYNQPSPCTIELNAFVAGETSIGFSGSVLAESGLNNASTRLFVVLITDAVTYSSPPGSNGETFFPHVFRDFWPSTSGQTFTLEGGDSYEFNGTLNRLASWDPDHLRVMAFVQTTSNHAILQAFEVEVNQFYGANMTTTSAHQSLQPTNAEQVYHLNLNSVGINEDNYTASIDGTFPAGWTHTIEATGVAPNSDQIDLTMAGGASTELTVRVNPNGHPGTANINVEVSSENMPTLNLHDNFTHMSGLDILVVDDDGGDSYQNYYTEGLSFALEEQGRDFARGSWDINRDALDATLDGIGLVIWETGATPNGSSLSDADMTMLSSYMDNGGSFILFSQGAGFDLRQTTFYDRYLHAAYTGNRPQLTEVVGINNDELTNGLDFHFGTYNGGDGIDQSRQHSLNASGAGVTCMKFAGSSNYCAVRFENETYKMFYAGFGYEGISDQATRTELMSRLLDWVYPTNAVTPGQGVIPAQYALGQNFPNPFNPTTSIPFVLPERAQVHLAVYDLLGREVATLVNGVMDAGQHSIEFDATELASGIYFYKFESASFNATRKLVLMK